MKIESIIRRKNGTVVTLDEHRYHFQPSGTDPRHLAEVTEKAHIARFLQIPEGYQVPDDETPVDPSDLPGPITGTLVGVQDSGGTVRTLAQLEEVELRALAIELEIEGAKDLPVAELITAIQAEEVEIDGIDTGKPADPVEQPAPVQELPQQEPVQEPAPVAQAKAPVATELDREALAKQFEEKFGKRPHGKLTAERIAQILAEDEAE